MQTADFTSILKDAPAGEWIALSHDEDRIVATSPDLENAIALAKDCGEAEPVLLKVPSTSMLVL
jgi:hypothetical protein